MTLSLKPRRGTSVLKGFNFSADPRYLVLRGLKPYPFRGFKTTSNLSATHYETLGVRPNATRLQIKGAFYKLSKKYHPDVNPSGDQASKDKFLSVSESYAILGDERRRRAYDKTLISPSGPSGHPHPLHRNSASYPDLSRRPRATHAWDPAARNRPPPPHRPENAGRHKFYHYPTAHGHRSGPGRSGSGVGTNSSYAKWDREVSAEEKVRRESGAWRLVQVVSVLGIIFTFAGGWG